MTQFCENFENVIKYKVKKYYVVVMIIYISKSVAYNDCQVA